MIKILADDTLKKHTHTYYLLKHEHVFLLIPIQSSFFYCHRSKIDYGHMPFSHAHTFETHFITYISCSKLTAHSFTFTEVRSIGPNGQGYAEFINAGGDARACVLQTAGCSAANGTASCISMLVIKRTLIHVRVYMCVCA